MAVPRHARWLIRRAASRPAASAASGHSGGRSARAAAPGDDDSLEQSKLRIMFSSRLPPVLAENALSRAAAAATSEGGPFFDLTETNPTVVGLEC